MISPRITPKPTLLLPLTVFQLQNTTWHPRHKQLLEAIGPLEIRLDKVDIQIPENDIPQLTAHIKFDKSFYDSSLAGGIKMKFQIHYWNCDDYRWLDLDTEHLLPRSVVLQKNSTNFIWRLEKGVYDEVCRIFTKYFDERFISSYNDIIKCIAIGLKNAIYIFVRSALERQEASFIDLLRNFSQSCTRLNPFESYNKGILHTAVEVNEFLIKRLHITPTVTSVLNPLHQALQQKIDFAEKRFSKIPS